MELWGYFFIINLINVQVAPPKIATEMPTVNVFKQKSDMHFEKRTFTSYAGEWA